MTLSTAALGGGSPNDKMDTILSVVYSMRDRMDNLVSKVGNMESKVNDIDNMEEITAEKVFFPTFFPSFSFQSFLYILNKNTDFGGCLLINFLYELFCSGITFFLPRYRR